MGGRGGNSGLTSNIAKFPKKSQTDTSGSTVTSSNKWDYRGYVKSVDNVENSVNSAKTRVQAEQAYQGILSAEKSITAEINHIENGNSDAGDIKVLFTQRRRLRQLRQKLIGKGILG